MINSPLFASHLKLRAPLTMEQVNRLVAGFDAYQENIIAQHNEAVVEWLKLKLIEQRQLFGVRLFHFRFYSDYELVRMLKRVMARLPAKKIFFPLSSTRS